MTPLCFTEPELYRAFGWLPEKSIYFLRRQPTTGNRHQTSFSYQLLKPSVSLSNSLRRLSLRNCINVIRHS